MIGLVYSSAFPSRGADHSDFITLAKLGRNAVIIAMLVSAPAPHQYGAGRDAALPGMPIPCPVSTRAPVPWPIVPRVANCRGLSAFHIESSRMMIPSSQNKSRYRWFRNLQAGQAGIMGALPILLSALLFLAGCSGEPPWHQSPTLQQMLWIVLGGFALNAVLLGALLPVWNRWSEWRRLRDALQRELRHLLPGETEEARLRKVGLIRDLNELGWLPAVLEEVMLPGADLRGVRLDGCNLRSARLEGADLQGASLNGADLFGADLSGANLALSSLRDADLRGCNLEGARLTKARLEGATLRRANLINADIQGVEMEHVRLDRSRFAAGGGAGSLARVHPSVEDWIRARLDGKGYYREEESPRENAPPLSDTG